MTLASTLLKAKHIGVRDLKAHLSEKLRSGKTLVVTDHGEPKQVIVPYADIVELAETLEELKDKTLAQLVQTSRYAREQGLPSIPVEALFRKIRASRRH